MAADHTPVPGMSAEQRRLVRQSYESIGDLAVSMSLLFYGRLFEIDPSARSLFHGDLAQQARKLTDTLSAIVESLDQFEIMAPRLAALGRQHAGYGVRPHHYDTVTTAIVWALGQAIGADFDLATREAWRAALTAISNVMRDAGAPQTSPDHGTASG